MERKTPTLSVPLSLCPLSLSCGDLVDSIALTSSLFNECQKCREREVNNAWLGEGDFGSQNRDSSRTICTINLVDKTGVDFMCLGTLPSRGPLLCSWINVFSARDYPFYTFYILYMLKRLKFTKKILWFLAYMIFYMLFCSRNCTNIAKIMFLRVSTNTRITSTRGGNSRVPRSFGHPLAVVIFFAIIYFLLTL